MIMRKIPKRGEKYTIAGAEVVVLEVMKDAVSVLLPNGKLTTVWKQDLRLHEIDTKNYEKVVTPRRYANA